jgi:GNAT superfamily N-acetyltransferase
MITIEKVDTRNKAQVHRFITYPFLLYLKNHKLHPQWVPPLLVDARLFLDRDKHPFYEHSDADFFIAIRNGKDVGRIAVLENRSFNQYHGSHQAQFYLFECENEMDIASALFDRASEWAHQRGLTHLVGPKGFGPLDGYGLLVEGFEHRQMMMMMNYNYEYYPGLVEALGFEKEVDFVSCYMHRANFLLPERIHRIVERVRNRGNLSVKQFKNKGELKSWATRIGRTYNQTFVNNWEYFPLSEREIDFVLKNILVVADPKLIKIIAHDQDVVGFLFAFPDVSAALQRARGRLFPIGLFDLLLELRRTKWVSINGAGVLQEYQGRGGNALLYAEMEKTVRYYQFEHADLTQVAETAVQMRHDLENLGGIPYKNHRVFRKKI